jgi:chemotaxis protein methyltransferase CheR
MVEMDLDLYNKLCSLVYDMTGLRFDEQKQAFIARRLERRLEVTGAANATDYYLLLRYGPHSGDELMALSESLTTNETHFFREYPQLQDFSNEILPAILEYKRKHYDNAIRLWSAGCSTGEEPYTLAIILREMIEDFDRWQIHLTATDLSRAVLQTAQRAIYGERALRDVPTIYREKYFQPERENYRVLPPITRMVRFQQANLMNHTATGEFSGLDFIFCRNVLIYFDTASCRKVVDKFYDALRPGGYIFLGHSESVGRITSAFRLVRQGKMFAYVK